LSRVVVNFSDTEEFFHNAGLWRMAKSCLIEGVEFRQAFRQRMPRDAGELFMGFIEKAGDMQDLTPEALRRLQDTILVRIRDLSVRQVISPRWGQLEVAYGDPQFAATFEVNDSAARAPFAQQAHAAAAAAHAEQPVETADVDDDEPGPESA
jgi:hypothetical protein